MQPRTLLHRKVEQISNTCGNFIIVVTQQEILVMLLTVFFAAASRRHNDIILMSLNVYLFTLQCLLFLVYVKVGHTAHVQQLNCCVKKCQILLRPTCGLGKQSCGLRDLRCHAASADRCLVRSWTVDFWWGYWPVARKTLRVCPC